MEFKREKEMSKVRKMLGRADSPGIVALMKQIETQSKTTIAGWCVQYAGENILPVYEKAYPEDKRPGRALQAAREFLNGKMKLPAAKAIIREAQAAAREAEGNPAAQAAARAVAQSAAAIHTPTHSLALAFYGAAALAYDRVGTEEAAEVYDGIAAGEFETMEKALRAVSVENEPDPAKIDWYCGSRE